MMLKPLVTNAWIHPHEYFPLKGKATLVKLRLDFTGAVKGALEGKTQFSSTYRYDHVVLENSLKW